MDVHVCFALWRLQASLEVEKRKQDKLEEERAAAVRLSEQRTAQLQEMVIQAQQQCLESIRASEAAAAKANARAEAAESRLEEVEKLMSQAPNIEIAEAPKEAPPVAVAAVTVPASEVPSEAPAQSLSDADDRMEKMRSKISIEITKPSTEDVQQSPVARSPMAGRSPRGGRSPKSPNPGILTPGVVERHILAEPQVASPMGSVGSGSKFPATCPEDDATKRSVKTLFVQCFKDDLFQERQLLMSQINNLFKLRNNGEALQYKEAGYEKLHNFLTDVPGLSLIGAGNRMELKLGDRDAFERFSDDLLEGREDLPTFDQPKPVPESFQNKVIEVFRRCGSREIPAKNFRDLWNCFFPHEKLQCKDYGYRDVKGLLANIPVVEKVGGKNSTKYVLKVNDVDFPEADPETKAVEEDDFVDVGTTPMAPMATSMPMAERAVAQPQRLELRNFVSEQIQPNHRSGGVNSLDDGAELEASRLMQARQVQAPGKWGASSSQARPEAWKDYGWPQELVAQLDRPLSAPPAQGQAADRLPSFRNDLPSQYPARAMNVPPQFLPQSAPHLQLGNPIQQQLLDLQMAAEQGAANRNPDPRFNQPHTEELLRLQQQVQQRLLQEQQRQQLLHQQLETIQPQQSFPPQLSPGMAMEQFQPPLVQDPNLGLPQYWNQHAPGDMDAPIAARTGSAEQQSIQGNEEIDQATAGDESLHLDLLLRASASKGLDAPETAAAAAAAQTRASRLARPRKSASAFVTSPATLRRDDEELIHASKFDVGSLYQATSFLPSFEGHIESLQNDRNCLLVHFANGRILFSNACCDRLFSVLTPLRHREITEIIAEEDRVNFSARIMYLSIAKFTVMEKTTFNVITGKGVVPANICGEHLMGSVWWMDCELIEETPSSAHGHLPQKG